MATFILRLPEVKSRTGLSRSQIYSLINQREFPRQVELGKRSVGWASDQIENWIVAKINKANHGQITKNGRKKVRHVRS